MQPKSYNLIPTVCILGAKYAPQISIAICVEFQWFQYDSNYFIHTQDIHCLYMQWALYSIKNL